MHWIKIDIVKKAFLAVKRIGFNDFICKSFENFEISEIYAVRLL